MIKNLYPSKHISKLFFFILLIIPTILPAQEIAIGAWRHHLPSKSVIALTETAQSIFAATPFGVLHYDKNFQSIEKIDKVTGLSDFDISVIDYSAENNLLIVGYQNGNIDVIKGTQILRVPDIQQANILGSKRINRMYFEGTQAILACNFGVVVMDLTQNVILDTWFIGPEGSMMMVFDFVRYGDYYYAATEAGLLRASVNAPNLADFQYWKHAEGLPATQSFNLLEVHKNQLFANMNQDSQDILYKYDSNEWTTFNPTGSSEFLRPRNQIRSSNGYFLSSSSRGVYVFDQNLEYINSFYFYFDERVRAWDALVDRNGVLWVGDHTMGLIKGDLSGQFESIIYPGPYNAQSYSVSHNGQDLWVAPGAILNGWQNTWNPHGIYVFSENKWDRFSRNEFPVLNDIRDIHQITPSLTHPGRVYASAWRGGLIEFDVKDGLIEVYNEENSTLQKRAGVQDFIRVGGSAWDSRGNLWVSNSDADHFLSVRKNNGQWMSYPHDGYVVGNETLGQVLVDNSDQKWVALPRGGGIIVFKETSLDNNIDFDIRKLNTQQGNGSLPTSRVTSMAKDKDGYIWVGTTEGVVVFYSPHMALRGQAFDAQAIIVDQDGFAGKLFENEVITSIFVDGSNKKWFGTVNSGAFLLSPDGRETLMHFTRSNSPLPTNHILDISVNPQTGEVFFATAQGLVSYRGFATEGKPRHASDVYAFPNPVRPGYEGYIAVKGLVSNARVKITDISGNLVYDTFAEGGQMVWNGKDLFGRKPGTGVYLVFSTDPDGNETMVTKILFIK